MASKANKVKYVPVNRPNSASKQNRKPLAQGRLVTEDNIPPRRGPVLKGHKEDSKAESPRLLTSRRNNLQRSVQKSPTLDLSDTENEDENQANRSVIVVNANDEPISPDSSEVSCKLSIQKSPARVICHVEKSSEENVSSNNNRAISPIPSSPLNKAPKSASHTRHTPKTKQMSAASKKGMNYPQPNFDDTQDSVKNDDGDREVMNEDNDDASSIASSVMSIDEYVPLIKNTTQTGAVPKKPIKLKAVSVNWKSRLQNEGENPEVWLEYIDDLQKTLSTDEFSKFNTICSVYRNSLRTISGEKHKRNGNYARLLLNYANYKGRRHPSDAEDILERAKYGVRRFAVVHIAYAEYEMQQENEDKALKILKRAPLYDAEPLDLIEKAQANITKNVLPLISDEDRERGLNFDSQVISSRFMMKSSRQPAGSSTKNETTSRTRNASGKSLPPSRSSSANRKVKTIPSSGSTNKKSVDRKATATLTHRPANQTSTPYSESSALVTSIPADMSAISTTDVSQASSVQSPKKVGKAPKDDLKRLQIKHDLLWANYLQWQFLNMTAKKVHQEMERSAMSQMDGMWRLLEAKRAEEAELQRKLLLLKHYNSLNKEMQDQEYLLEPIVEKLGSLQTDYDSLAENLDTTRHQIQTEGIHIPRDEDLLQAELISNLKETEKILNETENLTGPEINRTAQYSKILKSTENVLDNECEEFQRCTELMSACQSLAIQESSLMAQSIQSGKPKTKPKLAPI